MRSALVVTAALALAMTFAGLIVAAGQKDTFRLTTTLNARSEVPRPTGVRPGATGTFTGTAVELGNDKARLTWRLTFSKLTGRAAAAHIHVGRPAKAGNVMVALCGPCSSGKRGSTTITHAQLNTIKAGRSYVNVHTAKNPAGEIRGQIKVKKTASGDSGPPAPPPPPPGEPPPSYPYP